MKTDLSFRHLVSWLLVFVVAQYSWASTNSDVSQLWDDKSSNWSEFRKRDFNRLYQSDPVLWRFVGVVAGKTALDDGCGDGYIAKDLERAGARVIATDLSKKQIETARTNSLKEQWGPIDFRVDDGDTLSTIENASVDVIVSNYVLMDCADLRANVEAMERVLKPGGIAVIVILHPCFPLKYKTEINGSMVFVWENQYHTEHEQIIPPFDDAFSEPFLIFHHTLTQYWEAFTRVGLEVVKFEEPRLTAEQKALLSDPTLKHLESIISIVFLLKKPDINLAYLSGAANVFLKSFVASQLTQVVFMVSTRHFSNHQIMRVAISKSMYLFSIFNSLEIAAELWCNYSPQLYQYNPLHYASSWIFQQLKLPAILEENPNNPKWNTDFKTGQKDFSLATALTNAAVSLYCLLNGITKLFSPSPSASLQEQVWDLILKEVKKQKVKQPDLLLPIRQQSVADALKTSPKKVGKELKKLLDDGRLEDAGRRENRVKVYRVHIPCSTFADKVTSPLGHEEQPVPALQWRLAKNSIHLGELQHYSNAPTDWRLPKLIELVVLYRQQQNGRIPTQFKGTFWSSDNYEMTSELEDGTTMVEAGKKFFDLNFGTSYGETDLNIQAGVLLVKLSPMPR